MSKDLAIVRVDKDFGTINFGDLYYGERLNLPFVGKLDTNYIIAMRQV